MRKTASDYMRTYRLRKEEKNECNRCSEKRAPGKSLCVGCAGNNSALMKALRDGRRAIGRCVQCSRPSRMRCCKKCQTPR